MLNYFRMKKHEWKIKAVLYKTIAALMDNQAEIVELLKNLYVALKDVAVEDLQHEFVSKLAELIHAEE